MDANPREIRSTHTGRREALLACIAACVLGCHAPGPAFAPPTKSSPPHSEQPKSELTANVPTLAAEPDTAPAVRADDDPRPLLARYPGLAGALAHERFGNLPTPVERLSALGARIGVPALYVKRDDQAGDPYGGNKVRKLEFVLAEAKRQGRAGVLTFGGVGSNHAVCTAVFAQKLGLTATLLLLPEPNTAHVREHLLANVRFGARMQLGSNAQIERWTTRAARDELGPDDPYVIPPGGTSPLGNVGFVNAAFELRQQVRSGELPEPDDVFIAAGTGGSAVGLAVGLSAAGMHTRVRAVRTSSTRYVTDASFARQFRETVAVLRRADETFPAVQLEPDRLVIVDGYVGRGYALETRAAEQAARMAEREAGLVLDPTYTAKTMAALVGTAKELTDEVVLFWYTYDARPIDVSMVRVEDVPPAFRGYFAGR